MINVTVDSVRFVAIFACLLASQAQAVVIPNATAPPVIEQKISTVCFGCICEASSSCDVSAGCTGEVCGPYSITPAYWSDGGKPTLNGEPSDADGAFARCTKDPFCSARAIQGYMNKFAKDCNGDGKIDCDDYARIHGNGAYACSAPLAPRYAEAYNSCIGTFGK